MNLWLVNPFDPLPGDAEQEGRYASLVAHLLAAGHEVTWWTSAFSHRFKKPVDTAAISKACERPGLTVRFLPAPPYQQNVSPDRLRNHRILANEFVAAATREDRRPDVVLASAPPPMLAHEAMCAAKRFGAAGIVDIQDLWPETFLRLVPMRFRPLARLALRPWARASRAAYAAADAIVGVADAYVARGVELSGRTPATATFPLGVDLADLDAAAAGGRCERFTKPQDELWLAYTGSLNRSYDCLTVIRAFAIATGRAERPMRLFVTGRGELAGKARRIVDRRRLENVSLTGFLDFPQWAFLLSQCDVGFNACLPEALIYLPNKIFYYMASGAAVLNTIPGQCSRIVKDAACGLDYTAGDADDCAEAVVRLAEEDDLRHTMQHASRRLTETTYDRKVFMPRYVAFIEKIAAENGVS